MIEYRSTDSGLTVAERVITVVAVPYRQDGMVEYRGELWTESFEPGAFNPLPENPESIRVNREHNRMATVGKTIRLRDSAHGPVAEMRIAETPLGDETLALAREGMLSASIGFGVPGSGQRLDRRAMRRTVTRAFFDHIALTAAPVYAGAEVVGVRAIDSGPDNRPPIHTPRIDSFVNDDTLNRVRDRYTK